MASHRLAWRGVIVVEHSGRRDGPRNKEPENLAASVCALRCAMRCWRSGRSGIAPTPDPVFLNKRGKPYADTRQTGGSPLASAHHTACRKTEIDGFRIHDWRHHFAVQFLKRGGNLRALCQIAGWSGMRMVQRYAVFEQDDLDEIMARTARAERRVT